MQTRLRMSKKLNGLYKEKRHNPGPIDGMMGPRTREALKSFQTASGLETTGTLNQETAEKLGVDLGPSKDSKDMNTGKNSSSGKVRQDSLSK